MIAVMGLIDVLDAPDHGRTERFLSPSSRVRTGSTAASSSCRFNDNQSLSQIVNCRYGALVPSVVPDSLIAMPVYSSSVRSLVQV